MLLLLLLLAPALALEFHHTWSVHVHSQSDPGLVAGQLGMVNLGQIGRITGHYLFQHLGHPRNTAYHAVHVTRQITSHAGVLAATQQTILKRTKRQTFTSQFSFNDKYFSRQWYLYGDYNNVTGAWAQGVTGSGVVVTILDDGLEYTHPDLQANYDAHASTDLNDHDEDPMPRYDVTNENKHGTRCAGEVASVADNTYCGVGAAYHSQIGGIRMLDGDVTDAVEASALGLRPEYIDIYSSSWGPDDDGRTVDGPGTLTKETLVRGVEEGRGGRGSLFVWASGNGGVSYDNCNCDGYTNSIYTLSIGSVSEEGLKPWYSEQCSSTLAVTYSSGGSKEKQIMSTDLRKGCTERHTGTSAAAPLAAGIFALVLQAYPSLTWRDVQHLVVRTSRARNIQDPEWTVNSAGFATSHKFGFGVIDAGGLVELARQWVLVPEKSICSDVRAEPDREIPGDSSLSFYLTSAEKCDVAFLEHVQCEITIAAERRGDISMYLTSPRGTKSTILSARRYDYSNKGFKGWPFLTVHMWGENPAGAWKLEVFNSGAKKMTLEKWGLVLHGTAELPALCNSTREVPAAGNKTVGWNGTVNRDSRNAGVKAVWGQVWVVWVVLVVGCC